MSEEPITRDASSEGPAYLSNREHPGPEAPWAPEPQAAFEEDPATGGITADPPPQDFNRAYPGGPSLRAPGPAYIHHEERTSFWREAGSLLRDLTFSILIAILVIVFVVQPVRVEGTSMLPRLHDGERIFVNKFVYRFEKIERGDIVVFWWPNDPSKSFIKRVIGLPGQTVSVRDGVVYIDGEAHEEEYLDGVYHRRHDHMPPVYVKEHHFFVMGDNRDASNDSRVWGLVPEKYIYGRAIFRYWPLENVGVVN
ncbi:MAG: signal peptidase I [Acidobacteria bacterium]|nr:signal peptidase I [Acidobacteriota bacterium]